MGVGMMHDYVAIFATTDGGQKWRRLVDPTTETGNNSLPQSCYKSGMAFIDAKNGWMAGSCMGVMSGIYFYRTSDVGTTWSLVGLPAPKEKPDIFTDQETACGALTPQFISATAGQVPVRCSFLKDNTSQAWLYVTQDGGKTWASSPLPQPYGTMDSISLSDGWWLGRGQMDASTGNKLYITINGGQSWKELIKTIWDGQPDFIDARTGWVVAKAGNAIALVKTTDGGMTWQELKPVLAP
jgi:photosystem II stability/assembly factor-like uncharacterized protein